MILDLPWNVIALQIFFGLALGCIYILLASGLSIIYGLLDIVNFAHGTFAMLGAFAVFVALSVSGSFLVGVLSAVIIVGIIGAICEFFLLRPLYGKDPLLPLLLTFGLSVAIPDGMKIIFGLIGKPVGYPESLTGAILVGSMVIPRVPVVHHTIYPGHNDFFMAFPKKSDLGMIIRASTRDSLMVQALGINVSRIWTIGFAMGIGLAGLAGAIAVPMMSATADMGVDMTMVAFVVTVVGGLGSLGGAIVGGLFIGLVVALASFIAGEYANVSMYFCMAIILLLRPRGLFGELGRE